MVADAWAALRRARDTLLELIAPISPYCPRRADNALKHKAFFCRGERAGLRCQGGRNRV
jgi:hypothetical protein